MVEAVGQGVVDTVGAAVAAVGAVDMVAVDTARVIEEATQTTIMGPHRLRRDLLAEGHLPPSLRIFPTMTTFRFETT